MLTEELKTALVGRIRSADKVDKIFLFGSQASGSADPDSDIDLLVILDQTTTPGSFKERSANYLSISRALRDLEKQHPIDLLVYTRGELEQIQASGNQFIQKVLHEGIELR